MLSNQSLSSLLDKPFVDTTLDLPNKKSGKVRDSYLLSDQRRLLITTDRLSAFDRAMRGLPYKGQVLNQLAAWWFDKTEHIIPNHKLAVPDPNALLAVDVEPFPVEVIVRGYMSGVTSTSLWYRYSLGERYIYGHRFPNDMRKNQQLPAPIITPTTKATGPDGHDERLTCEEVVERGLVDIDSWDTIQAAALELFKQGQHLSRVANLILVDTKYEFGRASDGRILLIDEVHTPDSSRFWKEENYHELWTTGLEPENLDKEFLRLAYVDQGYRGEGEPPKISDAVCIETSQRYIQLYEQLTGEEFVPASYPVVPRLTENLQLAQLYPSSFKI